MISVLLSSCIAEIENVEIIRIEQALVKKTNMDVNHLRLYFNGSVIDATNDCAHLLTRCSATCFIQHMDANYR